MGLRPICERKKTKKREEIWNDRNKGTGSDPVTICSSPGDGAGLGFEVRLTDPAGPRRSKTAALNGESGGGSRLEAKVKVMYDVTMR